MTGIQRHFLGWKKPFLPSSAKWLQEHYLQGELGSVERLFILVSGQAFARRLQSEFVTEANKHGRAVELPSIETTSQFVKKLLPSRVRIADPQSVLLATATVMRGMPQQKIQPIIGPRFIEDDDVMAWHHVSRRVWETIKLASGGGVSIQRTTWNDAAQMVLTEDAERRFDVLAKIQNEVKELLALDKLSIFELEQLALVQPSSSIDVGALEHVVVVGGSDLSGVAQLLLKRLSDEGVTVDVLIRAPESQHEGFDAYGCIKSEYWLNATIDIADEDIVVAGTPSSQSAEVIRALSSLGNDQSADTVTIAATDEDLIPILQRHLQGHGLRSRFAGGLPVVQTSEALLIAGTADFVSSQSYAAYAAIVRHPDIVNLLEIKEDVLERLSRYSMNVVPSRLNPKKWFIPKSSRDSMEGLAGLHTKVFELFQAMIECETNPSSIAQCSGVIRKLLLQIYGSDKLDRTDPALKALQQLFGVLDRFDVIPEQLGKMRVSEVMQLMLEELELSNVPALPDPAAIDTVGWLEGMTVDTPNLIVVGMSSDLGGGNNPSGAYFPDALLHALELETIDRRMARDAHAIIAMQQSRQESGSLKWIVGRKNTDGDPLSPSPLLMRCDNLEELPADIAVEEARQLATRSGDLVVSFDSEQPIVPPQFDISSLGSGIQIPKPSDFKTAPLQKLSVTAFKDYLSCSYRFWLKHVLKLGIAEEGGSELDAKLFGTFIHAVLQRFGEDASVKSSLDVTVIENSVFAILEEVVDEQLGQNTSGKIRVQVELAKYRLREFAKHQAMSAAEGWKIVCTEVFLEKEIEVEGKKFTIRGVIDRVETDSSGRIRILDYKTGSTSANKAHFKRDCWIDLQLPLYRLLLSEIPALKSADTSKNNVLLGYFKIGDQESTSGIDYLTPPDKVDAILQDTIDGTILSILDNVYDEAPSTPAPKFSDAFSWICQDNSVIEESSDFYG
jgi:ATP-dependent helicase/nuclease subunit B